MPTESGPIFSADGTVAFIFGGACRVLTLNLPSVNTSADISFPTNIRDTQKSLKPGENIEWYLRDDPGIVNNYKVKFGDMIAEEFGFKGVEGWMLLNLPPGFSVFTSQKGMVNDMGNLVIVRQDSYIYGHPSGGRYRSTKEFLPHLIGLVIQNEGSLSGHPRNTEIAFDPLHTCVCRFCAKIRPRSRAAMANQDDSAISKMRSISITANYHHALVERGRDLKDGAWRFRQGELVWAFEPPRKPTGSDDLDEPFEFFDPSDPDGIFGVGGRWIAGYIVDSSTASVAGASKLLSIDDFAEAYTVNEPDGTHYRIQKCGSDNYVKDYNLRHVLPWVKTPVRDDFRGIVVDHVSEKAALYASKSVFQVARKNTPPLFDGAKIIYDLEGVFVGPEKIWIGDAIRIHKKNPPPPHLSVWDPASHALMIVRSLAIAVGHTENQPADSPRFVTLYFVGDLLSTDPARPLDPPPFKIPLYLEKAGTDYGKWVAGANADGKAMEGTVNPALVLSRYYDPRIMQLIDTAYQTIDGVIKIEGAMHDRARSCGFTLLNGEHLRAPVTQHGTTMARNLGGPLGNPELVSESETRSTSERPKRPKLR
ncbi:hypothetical protein TWF730_002131 [Orbilia blumenaviensis]|uniref:Cryptic loci regulator 2 N-terminal domain-containing protein n=1 Tax=Orbilia blumenaviensis TaxID=1796055 RepID=A0AAV9UDW4_9PEZI